MLTLEGTKEWHTHEPTGSRYELLPIDSEKYQELRKASRLQDGAVDFVLLAQKACVFAIKDWSGVGEASKPLPCTEENVLRFARAHATGVASWVIDKATALDRFVVKEEAEAKKD